MSGYKEPTKPIGTVAELFAGVGGFRIGLARSGWKTVFSNQWEPSTKTQHASDCYVYRFGSEGHANEDIEVVLNSLESGDNLFGVPDADLLVGGFPCQDYSVAKTLNTAYGLKGKKGVLWWQIERMVRLTKPSMLLLENVDRLLKSPASQRGRDFAIMLASLSDLGYMVEWRVINAADYGFPQRRRRVFIVARRKDVLPVPKDFEPTEWMTKKGVLARALPVRVLPEGSEVVSVEITGDLAEITEHFDPGGKVSPFRGGGVLIDRVAHTYRLTPKSRAHKTTLGEILVPEDEVHDHFFVDEMSLTKWKYLKGAKREERIHKDSGVTWTYSEGGMSFPEPLDEPSRTVLTGEGGSSPSRFKHIIQTPSGRYRRLMPIELERLNGFPDDWTRWQSEGIEMSDVRRAFCMGNALVVGVVGRIGKVLAEDWAKRPKPRR